MKSIKDTLKMYKHVLNHLLSHILDIKEPIDPKDYKQVKEIIDAIYTLKKHIK
jgi:hypothetical protein